MKDHPYYVKLMKDPWDRYRDLKIVWDDPISKQNNFKDFNTLCIDSDDTKVQLCLDNAITNRPYKLEDV